MVRRETQERSVQTRALVRAALCLLLALQAGCATHRAVQALQPGGGGRPDTLAVIPFLYLDENTTDSEHRVRHAICEALAGRGESYTVAIQPETTTDERLRAAGWRRAPVIGSFDSATCGYSGARFVMIGKVDSWSQASFGSFLVSLLTLGMVPPQADADKAELDVAIYECPSGERVWSYRAKGLNELLSSPRPLRETVGEPIAQRLPFARR